jgi:hypothetical protein
MLQFEPDNEICSKAGANLKTIAPGLFGKDNSRLSEKV